MLKISQFLVAFILFVTTLSLSLLYSDALQKIEKQQKEINDLKSLVLNQQAMYTNSLNSLVKNKNLSKSKE
jgi:preprotein translocase subunit SecG